MADRDVSYFRQLVVKETEKLSQLCRKWQTVLSSCINIPEDAEGQIRTTIGQTELLMDQRFKQFSGLIDNCEFHRGEKETTCQDLQGFWDMIYFQVEDVNKKFEHLEKLQQNRWEFENDSVGNGAAKKFPKKSLKINKQLPATTQSKSSSSVKAHILAARKRLAEAKARVGKPISSSKILSDIEENKENKIYETSKSKNSPLKSDNKISETCPKLNVPSTTISRRRRTKDKPLPKNYIPLAAVTRSAKRALLAKNQAM